MPARRDYYDKSTEAENACRVAVFSVEKLGADERLTKAINLLHMARNLVADFIDGVPVNDWKAHLLRELDDQRLSVRLEVRSECCDETASIVCGDCPRRNGGYVRYADEQGDKAT